MYAVLAEESLTRFCSTTESTMDAKDSLCLHAHNRISNSAILNNNFFIAKWFVCMCLGNGIANEAIVLLLPVRTASWDFKVVQKWWLGTAQCKMKLVEGLYLCRILGLDLVTSGAYWTAQDHVGAFIAGTMTILYCLKIWHDFIKFFMILPE